MILYLLFTDSAQDEGIPLLRPPILHAGAAVEEQDPALRLDIGICNGKRDGDEVLEVGPRTCNSIICDLFRSSY